MKNNIPSYGIFVFTLILIMSIGYLAGDYLNCTRHIWNFQLFLLALIASALWFAKLGFKQKNIPAQIISATLCALLLHPFIHRRDTKEHQGIVIAESQIGWAKSIEEAQKLNVGEKILLVDFYATWCEPCMQFEKETFSDPTVQDALRAFQKVRLDFTDMTPSLNKVASQYKVEGLPTMIFLTPTGEEIKGSRILGFLAPDEFKERLQTVLARKVP